MARVTLGEKQDGSYLIRNVRVKSRFSSLEERITWDTNKGAIQKRPGRERQQEKWVKDNPIMELILPEYQSRIDDAILVITRGWELVSHEPVECWMGDLILDGDVLYFSAKVRSNNTVTTCGFLIDVTPAFSSPITVVADESPVTDLQDVKINGHTDVSALHGLNLYIIPFAADDNKTAYGIIKHIELPSLELV